MEAPEKIYVGIGPQQSLIARAGQTLKSDIEYIRKDALLAWVEKMEQVALNDMVDGKPVKGNLATWRRIAIKIKSM